MSHNGFDREGVHGSASSSPSESATEFYTAMMGPLSYVEGDSTRGWRLGDTWLTLLVVEGRSPRNVEIPILASTPAQAERGIQPRTGLACRPAE